MISVQLLPRMPASTVSTPSDPASTNNSTMDVATDRGPRVPSKNGVDKCSDLQNGDPRTAVIVYGSGQGHIVSVFADVLGKPHKLAAGFRAIDSDAGQDVVLGITSDSAKVGISSRDRNTVVAIHAHCVNSGMPPDQYLSSQCDYEFLYTESPFSRRDLSRFVSFTLGQINHHHSLMAKPRTFFLSMTFPDVRAALPNIDILTVGADAVELRVDLLKEPLADGTFAPIPSLSYVGEQVMLLRQRTELPIIFTTRCTRENGRFPMEDPELYRQYLYRAIQWGVEYIDVEVWLPEDIRKHIYDSRGHSRVMSAFHDYSGTFKWPSEKAESIFVESSKFGDIVKMITIINEHNENFELEYFRSKLRREYPNAPPFCAVNMGELGQISRTLNKVLTPITHPLLPTIAAPGQMSTAEINAALSLLGQLPKRDIFGINSPFSRIATPHAPFYEKCFNELGLPHHFSAVERQARSGSCVEAWCNQRAFGGAYLSPPVSIPSLVQNNPFFAGLGNGAGPELTDAARMIGLVDTIIVNPATSSSPSSKPTSIPPSPVHKLDSPRSAGQARHLPLSVSLTLDNASWKGILSTLTRDLAPSAYAGRTAVVLASNPEDASSTLYALKALRVGKIYTVGFKTPLVLARGLTIEPFNSLESLQRARMVDEETSPFVIISALGPEKANIVGMLVRVFGGSRGTSSQMRRVFLDLADGPRKGDPGVVAEQSGFSAYGVADTTAFTTVETLRLLVGQNVPYNFVRLASGQTIF